MIIDIDLNSSSHKEIQESLEAWNRGELNALLDAPIDLKTIPGQPTIIELIDVRSESPADFITLKTITITPFYDSWNGKGKRLAEDPDQCFNRSAIYQYLWKVKITNKPLIQLVRGRVHRKIVQYKRLILPFVENEILLVLCWVDFLVQMQAENKSLLTQRERQCLMFIAAGLSAKEIANRLNISCRTVEHHLASAKQKLNAKNATHAASINLLNNFQELNSKS